MIVDNRIHFVHDLIDTRIIDLCCDYWQKLGKDWRCSDETERCVLTYQLSSVINQRIREVYLWDRTRTNELLFYTKKKEMIILKTSSPGWNVLLHNQKTTSFVRQLIFLKISLIAIIL